MPTPTAIELVLSIVAVLLATHFALKDLSTRYPLPRSPFSEDYEEEQIDESEGAASSTFDPPS